MKKLFLMSLLAFSCGIGLAQNAQTFKSMYKQAVAYNDLSVATEAVYGILATEPKATHWRDTLAILYFQRGGYEQATTVAGEILQDNPEKTAILELLAVSQQSVGLLEASLSSYRELYKRTKNIFHAYEMATILYSLKKYDEAQTAIASLLSDPAIEDEKIGLNVGPNQRQSVPLRAAVYNLRGVAYLESGQKEEAKKNFSAALKIEPSFVLPQNNLEFLAKESEK